MSGDQLVYNIASENETTPSIFTRKEWISILDIQNGNYSGANAVIDTSQISNSNKYANYREAYLTIPLLMTLTSKTSTATVFAPNTPATSADYALGLKNSFLHIIHSLQIEYNGTSVTQIVPYSSIWNHFKLMTTLSWNDVITQGASIGFWPDTSTSFTYNTADNTNGSIGTSNNLNAGNFAPVTAIDNTYTNFNEGFLKRQQYINYDEDGYTGASGTQSQFKTLLTKTNAKLAYKSCIINKINGGSSLSGSFQIQVMANVMLKHLHSFFDKLPLLKGAFMRITCNLNHTGVGFTATTSAGACTFSSVSVTSAYGGVNPMMIASGTATNGSSAPFVTGDYYASICVGQKVLDSTHSAFTNNTTAQLANILLTVPLYTFNPIFESAYLSNPVKTVVYDDIYNYNYVNSIASGGSSSFNFLVTNGISNLKSVLVIPFYSKGTPSTLIPIQSPFDTAGATSSPLCLLSNFNCVVSGSNAIYNNDSRSYSFFLNQLAGCNAINAGETDGITSSLITQLDFETLYNYYYVDISRSLPIEKDVPKSISIIGTSLNQLAVDLYVFVCFSNQINIDVLSGAKV